MARRKSGNQPLTEDEKARGRATHGARLAGELETQRAGHAAAAEKAKATTRRGEQERAIGASRAETMIKAGFKPPAAKVKAKKGDRTAFRAKKAARQEQLRKHRAFQAQQEGLRGKAIDEGKAKARPGTFRGGAPIHVQTQKGVPGVSFTREQITRGGPALAERGAELRRQATGARQEHDIRTGRQALERLSGLQGEREAVGPITGAGAPARGRALDRSAEGLPALRAAVARGEQARLQREGPARVAAAPTPTPAAQGATSPLGAQGPAGPSGVAPVAPQIVPGPTMQLDFQAEQAAQAARQQQAQQAAMQAAQAAAGLIPGFGGPQLQTGLQQVQQPVQPQIPAPALPGTMPFRLGQEPQAPLPQVAPQPITQPTITPQQVLGLQGQQAIAQGVAGLNPQQIAQMTAELEGRFSAVRGAQALPQAQPVQPPFLPQITQPQSSFLPGPGEQQLARPDLSIRGSQPEGGQFEALPETHTQRLDREDRARRGAATQAATDIATGKITSPEVLKPALAAAAAITGSFSGDPTPQEANSLTGNLTAPLALGTTPDEKRQLAQAIINSPGYRQMMALIPRMDNFAKGIIPTLIPGWSAEDSSRVVQTFVQARNTISTAILMGKTPTPEDLKRLTAMGA